MSDYPFPPGWEKATGIYDAALGPRDPADTRRRMLVEFYTANGVHPDDIAEQRVVRWMDRTMTVLFFVWAFGVAFCIVVPILLMLSLLIWPPAAR